MGGEDLEKNIGNFDKYRKLLLAEIKLFQKRDNNLENAKVEILNTLKIFKPIFDLFDEQTIIKNIQSSVRLLGDITFLSLVENPSPLSKSQIFIELLKSSFYPKNTAEIVVGYEGSESLPNIRIFSYLIPALETMRLFSDIKKELPTMRVVNARSASTRLNDLDPLLTLRNALATNEWLQKFVNTFYSDLSSKINFTIPNEEEIFNNPLYHHAVGHIIEELNSNFYSKITQSLVKKAHKHNKTLSNIPLAQLSKAQLYSLVLTVAQYVSIHFVESVFGDARSISNIELKPSFSIKLGGEGEKDFNQMQRIVANKGPINGYYRLSTTGSGHLDNNEAKPIHITSKVSPLPPYYAGNDELFLNQIDKNISTQSIIDQYTNSKGFLNKDIKLIDDAIGMHNFVNFLKYVHSTTVK